MSVSSCDELVQGRPGSKSIEDRGHPVIAYTRTFKVETSVVTDDSYLVMRYDDVPDVGDRHPSDDNARCFKVRAESFQPDDTGLLWLVSCEYQVGGKVWAKKELEDPTDKDPDISFGWTTEQMVLERSYDWIDTSTGAAVVGSDTQYSPSVEVQNSGRQKFEDPVVNDFPRLVISITQNFRTFQVGMLDYQDSINNADIIVAGNPIGKWCGLMRGISSSKHWDRDGDLYWEVHFEIVVDGHTHVKRIRDAGLYKKSDDGTDWVRIKDEDDANMAEVKPMNGAGDDQAFGADPVYLYFMANYPKNWALLPLPSGID